MINQLSPHFAVDELLNSPTATLKGFSEQFTPPASVISNLQSTCNNLAEKVRAALSTHFGHDTSIHVTSGYRCPRLNAAIGGMPNSQHLTGEAFDSVIDGMTVQQYYDFVKKAGIAFDELIIEHDSQGHYWVHMSYAASGEQRGACFTGVKLDSGGTATIADGFGLFKTA